MKIKVNNDILVWARQELNITQEEVADRMGRNIEEKKQLQLQLLMM